MPAQTLDPEVLQDIVEWDVASWKAALPFWEDYLGDMSGLDALDLGARHGGLSLYFALRGCRVTCSDLTGPTERARQLHRRYGVADRVSYASVDATHMPFPDGRFDIVCFKSVLGGVGRGDKYANQQLAAAEIHRVLKAGGRLVFAENLTASWLHALCRNLFVPWGESWRYLKPAEIRSLFRNFDDLQLSCRGCCAAFGRTETQRRILHGIDVLLNPFLPEQSKYIVLGGARKAIAAPTGESRAGVQAVYGEEVQAPAEPVAGL